MAVLDSSVMIALLNGSSIEIKKVNELTDNDSPVSTTIITAYELLKGAMLSSKRQMHLNQVKEVLSQIEVLDLTAEACEEASNIYSDLRKKGTLISEFDILIAAIAKTNNQAVLTYDKRFESISGLQLIKW